MLLREHKVRAIFHGHKYQPEISEEFLGGIDSGPVCVVLRIRCSPDLEIRIEDESITGTNDGTGKFGGWFVHDSIIYWDLMGNTCLSPLVLQYKLIYTQSGSKSV